MKNIVQVKMKHITKLIDRYWKLCMGMIILIQLLLCVFVLAKLGVMHVVDTPSYLEPTYSFLELGRMLSQGEPILFRTPGYIFFLAVVLGITSGSEWAVVCIQIVMWLGATAAIFYVVSRLTGRAYMGILACLLYTANLSAYEFPCSLQTDGFFACLLIFALWCFYRYIESQKFGYMIGTFALLIYALLVRPQLTYFCMILAGVLIIGAIFRKVSWKIALLYCSMFLLAYGGWSARNASYYGDWMYSSVQDFNYMYFYAPGVYVLVEDGAATEDAIAYLEDRLADTYPDHENYGAIELAHAQKEIGSEYMKEHPAEFVQLCFRGAFYRNVWTGNIISGWNAEFCLS